MAPSSSISGGGPRAAAWFAVCFVALSLQTRALLAYHKSLPLLSVSLTDLVRRDLVVCYFACVANGLFMAFCIDAGVSVPSALAYLIVYFAYFASFAVLVYVLVLVVVEYAHQYTGQTSLFETWSDEQVQKAIRKGAAASCFSLCGCLYFMNDDVPTVYAIFTRDYSRETSPMAIVMIMLLASISLVVNITLKILMALERMKTNAVLIPQQQQQQQEQDGSSNRPYGQLLAYLFFSCVCVAAMAGLLLFSADEEQFLLLRLVSMPVFAVVLPFAYIVRRPKIRAFAVKHLCRAATLPCVSPSQVHPAAALED